MLRDAPHVCEVRPQHGLHEALKARIRSVIAEAAGAATVEVEFMPSNAVSFLTKPGDFSALVSRAITEVTGLTPELSTSGGTSDARFIKNYCPVLEFGLVGQTMHQINERVETRDLVALADIYQAVMARYFSG